MTAAQLTYTSNPTQVAISASGSTSEVGITFLIANKGPTSASMDQIVLTIPQGDGETDLIAANTTFDSSSVHSSNSSSWSLATTGNQAILMPVAQGVLAPGDSLQFTLSGLQINGKANGAGKTANIAVVETIHNGGYGNTQIRIQKIAPGFYIESFYLDQYNVAVDSPVTVTWKVVGALSCSITAKIIQMTSIPGRGGRGCGVGTNNPVCDGTIHTGTNVSDSHTCNVQGATVFTLSAQGKGAGGDVTLTSQLLVTVNEPAIRFVTTSGYISLGAEVTLNWVSADAAKLTLQAVPLSGSGQPSTYDITGDPVGKKTFQPLVDTAYWLNAYSNPNPPPNTPPATQMQLPVKVELPRWSANLSASNVATPAYPDDTVTLDWAVLNVDHCDLTCDQAGFAPQKNLPDKGPLQVKLPDPGVANGTATFTLTPVEYGGLGNFTATSTTVAITNVPHFSENLAANPSSEAPGGSCTFSWALDDRAETAVLSNDLPGATPQTVDPALGKMVLPVPSIVIPTPIVYTLTASRQNQKYIASTATTVQCTGDASVLWCRGKGASGKSLDYLDSLYVRRPNQRIRKVELNWSDGVGVYSILVWYSDAASADYVIALSDNLQPDQNVSLMIPVGDRITTIYTLFAYLGFGTLDYIKITTAGGASVEIGESPEPSVLDGPYQVSTGADQTVAFTWDIDYDRIGGIGLVSCTNAYGQ